MNTQRETASYIADMLLELRNLAKHQRHKTLQGLLEITYYEAYGIAHAVDIPEGAAEAIHELGADVRKREVA